MGLLLAGFPIDTDHPHQRTIDLRAENGAVGTGRQALSHHVERLLPFLVVTGPEVLGMVAQAGQA